MMRFLPAAVLGCLVLLASCTRNVNPIDLSDPGIAARLKAELKGRPHLDISAIAIDVHSGIVTLSGIVESDEQRGELVRVIRRVKGVRQMILNLVVRQ